MSFIQRNANIVLLFLVVLAAFGLALTAVFSVSKLNQANDQYNKKIALIKDLENKANALLEEKKKIEQQANITQKREQEISGQFKVTKEAKEKTESELKSTISQKEKLDNDLQLAKEDLEITKREKLKAEQAEEAAKIAVIDCQSKLSSCSSTKLNLESQISVLQAALNNCQSGG